MPIQLLPDTSDTFNTLQGGWWGMYSRAMYGISDTFDTLQGVYSGMYSGAMYCISYTFDTLDTFDTLQRG